MKMGNLKSQLVFLSCGLLSCRTLL